jgi:GAF domain-containing protein
MKSTPASVVAQLLAKTREADDPDVSVTLHAVTGALVELGVADMAGITERRGQEEFSSTAATDDSVERAACLQYRRNEGPCVQAIYDQGIIVSNDVAVDPRWPRWGPQVQSLGVRAAMGVHLFTTQGAIGALNLYNRETQDYTCGDLELAKIFGSHVSIMLAHQRNDQNLWNAVDARHRIGQAQGILDAEVRHRRDRRVRRPAQALPDPEHQVAHGRRRNHPHPRRPGKPLESQTKPHTPGC